MTFSKDIEIAYLKKRLQTADALNAWDAGQNNLLKAELGKANAALTRVRDLHSPRDGRFNGESARFCGHCKVLWPCKTVTDLDQAEPPSLDEEARDPLHDAVQLLLINHHAELLKPAGEQDPEIAELAAVYEQLTGWDALREIREDRDGHGCVCGHFRAHHAEPDACFGIDDGKPCRCPEFVRVYDETPEELFAAFDAGVKGVTAPPRTGPEEYRALFEEAWRRPPTEAELAAVYPPVEEPKSSQLSEVQP